MQKFTISNRHLDSASVILPSYYDHTVRYHIGVEKFSMKMCKIIRPTMSFRWESGLNDSTKAESRFVAEEPAKNIRNAVFR